MQVSQAPYLYTRVSLTSTLKYPSLHMSAHQMVNSMAPQSDRKWWEPLATQPIIASHLPLHLFWTTTFTISIFGSKQELFYPYLVHYTIYGVYVTSYSELHNAIITYWECKILPCKVICVL